MNAKNAAVAKGKLAAKIMDAITHHNINVVRVEMENSVLFILLKLNVVVQILFGAAIHNYANSAIQSAKHVITNVIYRIVRTA